MALKSFILETARVRLEPMTVEHADALALAANEDRASYRYTWVPDGREDAERYVEAALLHQAEGRAVPFVVRRTADGLIVGSTRFLDLEVFIWPPPWPPGVARGPVPSDELPPSVAEIGSTWFSASAQRTGINLECKLLMLGHAFEEWNVLRVTLKADSRNLGSRRSIESLGAVAEGVQRVHGPASDGAVRDTAYYSLLASEWPAIRAQLERRLRDKN